VDVTDVEVFSVKYVPGLESEERVKRDTGYGAGIGPGNRVTYGDDPLTEV
jgi:hypothetical protein